MKFFYLIEKAKLFGAIGFPLVMGFRGISDKEPAVGNL